MPKATRSPEEIQKVRDNIIDRSLDLIAKTGIDDLSMAKLGKVMKMTAANLYNYYSNKDDLLISIHKKIFRLLHDDLANALKPVEDPAQRLHVLVRAFVDFGVNNLHIYDMMFTRPRLQYREFRGTPLEQKAYEEYLSSMDAMILASKTLEEFLASRPGFQPERMEFLTIKFLSQIHGIISLYNSGILFDIAESADDVLDKIVEETILSVTDPEKITI